MASHPRCAFHRTNDQIRTRDLILIFTWPINITFPLVRHSTADVNFDVSILPIEIYLAILIGCPWCILCSSPIQRDWFQNISLYYNLSSSLANHSPLSRHTMISTFVKPDTSLVTQLNSTCLSVGRGNQNMRIHIHIVRWEAWIFKMFSWATVICMSLGCKRNMTNLSEIWLLNFKTHSIRVPAVADSYHLYLSRSTKNPGLRGVAIDVSNKATKQWYPPELLQLAFKHVHYSNLTPNINMCVREWY